MSKILVTGGCGFIGSNFIRYLLENTQHEIVNVDKITYAGHGGNLKHMGYYVHTHLADICDIETIDKIFAEEKPDYVVNFAAETHVDNSITGPLVFPKSNVLGVSSLLAAAKNHGIERFLQISTDEVYGSMGLEDRPWKEGIKLKPRSVYSASKAGAEHLTNSYHITFGLPTLITRSSNNYGPYQFPEKFIPLFVTNLIQGKKVPVYGTGMNVRDWLHVEDNCRAVYHVLMNGKIGETYNIAGNDERSNIDVTRMILKHFKYGDEMMEMVADRLGHDLRYSIDSSKLSRLGFELKHKDFKLGLEETINWYMNNEKWWRPLLK
jgi:dTDP-glucose 4,6-dehydratase